MTITYVKSHSDGTIRDGTKYIFLEIKICRGKQIRINKVLQSYIHTIMERILSSCTVTLAKTILIKIPAK